MFFSEYRNIYRNTFATSSVTTPFTFLTAIRNDDQKTSYYQIRVLSDRSSSFLTSETSRFEGNKTNGNFYLEYHAVQYYELDGRYRTECRVYFYVSNVKDWKSVLPSRFWKSYESTSSFSKYVDVRVDGSPSRILFGYMLLSRDTYQDYSSNDLDIVASSILANVVSYPNLMDAWKERKTLIVPVTFDVGSKEAIMNMNPPNMRKQIQPGYLQFRAYNFTGYPNALCPGVSVEGNMSPAYICVGGSSNDVTQYGTCGDFAGWGGMQGDSVLSAVPNDFAHSLADTSSTLLMFYR